ncbi:MULTISPECIES: hypothetical protein [unclassified Mesorhizobium]|uniref:hypothetical protein n=1 Tax=unclassified Mesorhizobium TaxID=325217 RepID=UPI001FD8ABC6|nr:MULTISPECIES: hypothetical protein [unclassified Mesorhizobium]WJI69388.1 hypothetical protein NLY36_00855 [Mesorhizobium sp. C399B]
MNFKRNALTHTRRFKPRARNRFRNILAQMHVSMVMKIEADECRAALTLIRRTIEDHCPPGVLPSEEAVNGLYGPGLMDEAEALAAAIVATIDQSNCAR